MKIKKRLNEELLEEYIKVIIPINVKFRTTSDEENDVVYYLEDEITKVLQENFEDSICNTIDKFLLNKQKDIEKQLNKNIDLYYCQIDLEEYNNVLSANGQIYFDFQYEGTLDESTVRNIFDTLLNDALINDEITIEYESEEYGDFDIIAEITKAGSIEIEGI